MSASGSYAQLIPVVSSAKQAVTGSAALGKTRLIRCQPASALAFGNTSTFTLQRSAPWLTGISLVLTVSALSVASGTVAYPNDASIMIANYKLSYGGTVLTEIDGTTISLASQLDVSPQRFGAYESATGANVPLALRATNAAAQQTFVINLPTPFDASPCPIQQLAGNLTIDITLQPTTSCLSGGGTLTVEPTIVAGSTYILQTMSEPSLDGQPDTSVAFRNSVVSRGSSGLVTPYQDPIMANYAVPSGSTALQVTCTQTRGLARSILAYLVANTNIPGGTARACDQYNTIAISNFQYTMNGVVVPDNQLDTTVARYLIAPVSGTLLNWPQIYSCAPICFDLIGDNEIVNSAGIDPLASSSAGRFLGGPGSQSITLALNLPTALAANSTCYLFEWQWNGLVYTSSANGSNQLDCSKLVN